IHGLTTANAEQNPPAGNWFQGAITLSSAGVVLAGSVDLSDGSTLAVTAGRLTVGSTGLITGTLNVAGTVLNVRATMTPDKNGVMEPGRDVIVGVVTRDLETGASDRIFFVAIRSTVTPVPIVDLAGTWRSYIQILFEGEGESGAWMEGPVTLRGTDGAVSATLRNADGSNFFITGTLTTSTDDDPATRLPGNLQLRFAPPVFP